MQPIESRIEGTSLELPPCHALVMGMFTTLTRWLVLCLQGSKELVWFMKRLCLQHQRVVKMVMIGPSVLFVWIIHETFCSALAVICVCVTIVHIHWNNVTLVALSAEQQYGKFCPSLIHSFYFINGFNKIFSVPTKGHIQRTMYAARQSMYKAWAQPIELLYNDVTRRDFNSTTF